MKSQIQVLILIFIFTLSTPMIAQPKLSSDLGFGFYEPTMDGFDKNEEVPFPTKSVLGRNILLNWGVYYEFFSNARIGYSSFTSVEIGKMDLQNSSPVFIRSLKYRLFPLETFFRWRSKIEINFTLAPIWGRGRITVETTPGEKTDDWNELLNSFGDSDPMGDMGSSDAMINDWIGYSGMIGIRYYLTSRIGLDFKAGFLNNSYDRKSWKLFNKKDIIGPELEINELPIFSFKIIYGIK